MNGLLSLSFIPLLIVVLISFKISNKIPSQDYQDIVTPAFQSELEESMTRGKIVYKKYCNRCHRPKGRGIGRSYPPLAGSDYLASNRIESIRGVKFGQQGEIIVNDQIYNKVMAPMGLTDMEIADVMNYIMNTWGNTQDTIVTVKEVNEIKN